MAVGERQAVHGLRGAGHGLGCGPDERGETRNALARRRALRAAPGKGIGVAPASLATASDSAPSAATRRRRSSPSSSSRRTSTSSSASAKGLRPTLPRGAERTVRPGGVAHGQAREAQTHAPGIVHEVGRSEGDRVAVAGALLQGGFDLVVQADEPNGPPRQHRGQRQPADDKESRRKFRRPENNVGDPAGADPAPAGWKARTLAARRHAAHRGPGPRPLRHVKRTDQ